MIRSDLDEVVAIHLHAFPGFFLSALGPRFLHLYYSCVIDYGQIALVAVEQGRLQGFVTGIENQAGFYRTILVRRGILFLAFALPAAMQQPWKVLPRLLRGLAKRPSGSGFPRQECAASLTSIAVRPGSAGKGVGRRLISGFKKEAASRGLRIVYLESDADGNDAVLQFYRREGFRIIRTYFTPEGRRLHEFALEIPSSEAGA